MLRFDVDATNPAAPRVTVGGREQKGLVHATVDITPGAGLPQLVLTYLAGGRFQGEGEVYVVQAGPEAVDAWLAAVSPAEAERLALELDEKHGPMSPGVMFLAALRSMARAQAEGGGRGGT